MSTSSRSRHSPASSAKKSAALPGFVMCGRRWGRGWRAQSGRAGRAGKLATDAVSLLGSRGADTAPHLGDRGADSAEYGSAHHAVTDVELFDLRDGGDGSDVLVRESVPRVYGETEILRASRRAAQLVERLMARPPPVRVAARVQLDGGNAKVVRDGDRPGVGVDEETHAHAGLHQARNGALEIWPRPGKVESAFRGDFLAALRHDGGLERPQPAGEVQNAIARGELEVEHRADRAGEPLDVLVLNVPAIFAKVGRDSVGAGGLARLRGGHGIGLVGPARFTDGRDVVDIDVETHGDGWSGVFQPIIFGSLLRRRPV